VRYRLLRRVGRPEERVFADVAQIAGFEVFLTGDTKIPEEQNMDGRRIAIVVMTAHQLSIVRDHVTQIAAAVASAKAGTIEVVECGKFRR